MFERFRFIKYALRFERAFRSDDWQPVKACFHPDATYTISGSDSEFDGVVRGPDAIAHLFKRMLDQIDRKYDKRSPGLRGVPRVRAGELTLPWKVAYTLGDQSVPLTGTSRCRWRGAQIIELSDAMIADEVRRWAALVAG